MPANPGRAGGWWLNAIRRQLTAIGFVQWQKSVYVCPHDIADDLAKLLRDNNLEDKVVPMIAKRILAGNDWDFARDKFRRLFARFVEVVKSDPLLPVGLAPKTGYGREQALAALSKSHLVKCP